MKKRKIYNPRAASKFGFLGLFIGLLVTLFWPAFTPQQLS